MSDSSPAAIPSAQVRVQVRYVECDPMNVAHHSVYPVWLEIARTQLLREHGYAYRDLEANGIFFVVARMNIRYRKPARYDDELTVQVRAVDASGVKIDHDYQIRRGDELLTTAETTIVCVDATGKVRPVPPELLTGSR